VMVDASVPTRRSAPAANSLPFTATVRKQQLRTRSTVLVAHVVCADQLQQCEHNMLTYMTPDQRRAGECTCSRASDENAEVTGSKCACGKRSAGELRFTQSCMYVLC
jgi:hypothetical protein